MNALTKLFKSLGIVKIKKKDPDLEIIDDKLNYGAKKEPVKKEHKTQIIQLSPDKKTAKIFNMQYRIMSICAWYELVDTEEEVKMEDLELMETESFSETFCGNPEWGPALSYAQKIKADYVLYGNSHITSNDDIFSKIHTTATFFKNKDDDLEYETLDEYQNRRDYSI